MELELTRCLAYQEADLVQGDCRDRSAPPAEAMASRVEVEWDGD